MSSYQSVKDVIEFSGHRASKNLFLTQRFARHASPLTTIVYTHPADEELYEGVRDLPC